MHVDGRGRKQGMGRCVVDGCFYEGEFLNDLKHGKGVLTWPDGRQYEGQFADGRFHGEARMVWTDGRE